MQLSKLFPNPEQPRKNFAQGPLEELAASIKEMGVMEPIIAVKRNGGFMIVAGERRYRACKIAGLKDAPVQVIEANDQKVAELALLENLQREDLNPLEEADGYQKLINKGLTIEEVAKKMGFKQTWRIKERTDLLKLDTVYQDMLAKGHINKSQAFELSRLDFEQQRILFRYISQGKADTYNKVRSLTNAILNNQEQETFIPEPSKEEMETKSKYDKMIDKLYSFIDNSFSKKDLKILESVITGNLKINVDKINLIITNLQKIRKAMIEAQSTQEIMAS